MPSAKSELDLYLRLKFLYVKTCYLSITDELTKVIHKTPFRQRNYSGI